ncbi:MAG: hypothetical protein IPG72_09600 [Ardenticatenales bacterium]|nr:hypothetical protein [Ardenticatenales bacterium]
MDLSLGFRRAATVAVVLCGTLIVGGTQPAVRAASPPRDQKMPTLAYMTDAAAELDDYFAVWIEDRGSGGELYGKRLFGNGLPNGGPDRQGIAVVREVQGPGRSSEPHGERVDPDLVWNGPQLELLLVWSEFTGDENGWDIFGVRVSPAGYSVGSPKVLVSGPGDQQHPDVAIQASEHDTVGYILVYDDNQRDLDRIMARKIRFNAIPNGKPFQVFAGETWNATDPTTNGAAVAWVDDRGETTEIYTIRLRNGLPNGTDERLAGTEDDDFNPNYGSGGLVWNVYDPATPNDILGLQVYDNNRTRGPSFGIRVPPANQSWPILVNGLLLYSDDRSGNLDLYAIRTANVRYQRGNEIPIVKE